jgi:hypothetical protein
MCGILIFLLRSVDFYYKGNEPFNLINQNCNRNLQDIIIDETIWYQDRIENNKNALKKLSFIFNLFIVIIIIIPALFFL